jgi:hypothetical protein
LNFSNAASTRPEQRSTRPSPLTPFFVEPPRGGVYTFGRGLARNPKS